MVQRAVLTGALLDDSPFHGYQTNHFNLVINLAACMAGSPPPHPGELLLLQEGDGRIWSEGMKSSFCFRLQTKAWPLAGFHPAGWLATPPPPREVGARVAVAPRKAPPHTPIGVCSPRRFCELPAGYEGGGDVGRKDEGNAVAMVPGGSLKFRMNQKYIEIYPLKNIQMIRM